jgi:hypothetical protein
MNHRTTLDKYRIAQVENKVVRSGALALKQASALGGFADL